MSAKISGTKRVTNPPHQRRRLRSHKLVRMAAMLLLFVIAEVRAQSALDGFDPNANGVVNVVVVQPDGKVLIGGDFTTLSPNGGAAVARNRIARLNPDGTLDTAFNPNANDTVHAIAVQADGKILVGGEFIGTNSIGGQTRNHIARLDATTGLADSFDPNADFLVFSIAVQADGRVLAGGDFTTMGGQTRNHIARLNEDGTLDTTFNPNANGFVAAIAVQTDGKILAGGDFGGADSIGGQTRNFIARLDPITGLADSFNPNANLFVRTIAVQADGKILAGGYFNGANSIGGQARNRIARLDPTTGLADSFDPNANNIVRSIAVQADGKILVGGFFSGTNSIGSQPRNFIARLDSTTGLADSFNPNPSGSSVLSIAVQPDGKILAGGNFTTLAPNGEAAVTRNRIARLETDGRLDQTLNINPAGLYVNTTAVQPDDKILIGGNFTSVLGVERNYVARLNSDGTLDTAFNPNATDQVVTFAMQADGKILAGGTFNGTNCIGGQMRNHIARLDPTTGLADSFDPNGNDDVVTIVVQADGKILVCGWFTSIGGQPRNHIARLDPTTGLADSFNPNASGNVLYSMAVQTDGKILAVGDFTNIGGQTRNNIARLDPTTGLADSFDPNANAQVFSIAVQADGKILAVGDFGGPGSIGGQTRNYIARLDATTGLADSFDPNANNYVISIAVQADGRILASGGFSGIGGHTRNCIARLDPTTGLADSFNPNAEGNFPSVYSIAVQPDGKILAGGNFGIIGGELRAQFARLTNDTAALQNLTLTQSAITWTRDGSSPQLTRVTFEASNDNVNYTPLGNGTEAGNTWTLTGLSLPSGLNFYIRARGNYRSGSEGASESITESVRNAFLPGPITTPTPPPLPSVTPTPTPSPTPTSTPTPTPTPTPRPATLANISTRLRIGTGDNAMIGGFIISGTQPKTVIVRGIGPSLSIFVGLGDPVIEVHGSSGQLLATNDNWNDALTRQQIIDSGLAPTNDLESALWGILNPGLYTVVVRGKNDATGLGLFEVYDLNQTVDSKLANVSTRGFVETGDNVMIGGTIITGSIPARVLFRAIGPSLTNFGVPNALQNPMLELHDGNGMLIAANDNWRTDQEAEIIATGIPPSNDLESAIVRDLAPGNYTAIVRGVNNATGVALIEAYGLN